ncbi:MAG: hypothetical protein AB7G04_08615 [Hyphomonadaceae bacterium]
MAAANGLILLKLYDRIEALPPGSSDERAVCVGLAAVAGVGLSASFVLLADLPSNSRLVGTLQFISLFSVFATAAVWLYWQFGILGWVP